MEEVVLAKRFSFPNRKRQEIRSLWISTSKFKFQSSSTPSKIDNFGVCAFHFTPDDYKSNSYSSRSTLKADAVPTRLLHDSISSKSLTSTFVVQFHNNLSFV